MITESLLASIKKWYSGKSLVAIETFVIPTLLAAAEQGYWPKGTAVKVRAALNKMNEAVKVVKKHDKFLDEITTGENSHNGARGWSVHFHMFFGHYAAADKLGEEVAALRSGAKFWADYTKTRPATAAEQALLSSILDKAAQWASDFAPVAALVKTLDARRIPPTLVFGSLSPTVATNLSQHLGIALDTIESPPTKTEWVKVKKMVKGREVEVEILWFTILWPEGTVHNASRFAFDNVHRTTHGGNEQCHACGHAIKDPWNWVPLMAKGNGKTYALWVGRDCARKLFNVDVTGDAEYTNRVSK